MKAIAILLFLAGALAAADPTGNWTAVFTCPPGERPKTVSEFTFDLKVEGAKITGTIEAGNWPGIGPVVDGRIDGEKISFTLIGELPWWNSGPGLEEKSGLPKLIFQGTINGSKMRLTLISDSIMLYGAKPEPREYKLVATRNTARN